MAETYNPADHTVDEVNAYLADADDTERQRVLDAEAGAEKPRTGITEGPHATSADEGDSASVENQSTDAEGNLIGSDPVTGGPAEQGHTTEPSLVGATFQEAAENATTSSGEAYEKGYFGYVPSKDGPNAVDLSVAGVTGQSKDA